ncbi:MAG: hypothetical protein ACHREM_07795 [Polyangiales bacterium]
MRLPPSAPFVPLMVVALAIGCGARSPLATETSAAVDGGWAPEELPQFADQECDWGDGVCGVRECSARPVEYFPAGRDCMVVVQNKYCSVATTGGIDWMCGKIAGFDGIVCYQAGTDYQTGVTSLSYGEPVQLPPCP